MKAAILSVAAGLILAAGSVVQAQGTPPADLESKAKASCDRGLKFIAEKIQPDGAYSKNPGITGIATLALLDSPSGYSEKDDFVKKPVEYLLKLQKPDGGIYERQIANYTTAIAVQVLVATKNPAYKDVLAKAQKYLLGAQMGEGNGHPESDPVNGGYDYGGGGRGAGRADLSNTQMVAATLRDLEKSGLPRDSEAWKRIAAFASRCQNKSETNKDIKDWEVTNDGGATYTPLPNQQYEVVLPDGKKGLRSYGSMTYAFMMTMVYADVKKDDPRVQSAVEWIRKNYTLDENPGVGQAGLFYYYHTMAKALKAMGEKTVTDSKGVVHDWRAELMQKVISLQNADGSWVNKNDRWFESDPVLVTAYGSLILEELLEK